MQALHVHCWFRCQLASACLARPEHFLWCSRRQQQQIKGAREVTNLVLHVGHILLPAGTSAGCDCRLAVRGEATCPGSVGLLALLPLGDWVDPAAPPSTLLLAAGGAVFSVSILTATPTTLSVLMAVGEALSLAVLVATPPACSLLGLWDPALSLSVLIAEPPGLGIVVRSVSILATTSTCSVITAVVEALSLAVLVATSPACSLLGYADPALSLSVLVTGLPRLGTGLRSVSILAPTAPRPTTA